MPNVFSNYFKDDEAKYVRGEEAAIVRSAPAVFNNVADAKAGNLASGGTVSLEIGRAVLTLGYTLPNDNGEAAYRVVAGGTGTEDGILYLNMTNGNQLERLDIGQQVFDTVADAVAAAWLGIGDSVKTEGFTTANDGGHAEYIVVAGGTGTNDGILHINSANGYQLQRQSIAEQVFDTVSEAKAAAWIGIGDSVQTKGYYSPNDGGGANYIVAAGGTGTDDGGSYHDMANGNQLELVSNESVHLKQFGAVGDGSTDDTAAIQNAINYSKNKTLYIQDGRYGVSQEITIDVDVKIQGTLSAHDNSGTTRNASWLELLTPNTLTADQAILNIRNTTGTSSIRRWVEVNNIGLYGFRDMNANGSAIITTARNVKIQNCSILQFPKHGIWSKDQNNAGSNSSYFIDNWVGFNGGTGLRMERTSFSGDNAARGGHYHWNNEVGVYINQPNTTLVGVYSWWNKDGFQIGEALSGLSNLAGCRGYDNARAGCYIEGEADNINISGDFHANGNDTRWSSLPGSPTFTDDERAGIYADGNCTSINISGVQFGFLSAAGKQRRGLSAVGANVDITLAGYGVGGDASLSVSATTKTQVKYHGTDSGLTHPGFIAADNINMDNNDVENIKSHSFRDWELVSPSAGALSVLSSTAVLNEGVATNVTTITSNASGIPIVIIRNVSSAAAVTFVHDPNNLRNIGSVDIVVNGGDSIVYVFIGGTQWQQIGGKQ